MSVDNQVLNHRSCRLITRMFMQIRVSTTWFHPQLNSAPRSVRDLHRQGGANLPPFHTHTHRQTSNMVGARNTKKRDTKGAQLGRVIVSFSTLVHVYVECNICTPFHTPSDATCKSERSLLERQHAWLEFSERRE